MWNSRLGGASLATAAGLLLAAQPALAAGQVSGKYLGNGKPAKLAYVVVVPHEPWNGEPAYSIVMSQKDPSGSKKPDFDALFGELGDALVVTITKGGEIIGTQVCHQSLKKAGFSSSGSLYSEGLKLDAKSVSGRFFTKKQEEFFGDTWEIDLSVTAPLPAGK
jgi:hypothetical protein